MSKHARTTRSLTALVLGLLLASAALLTYQVRPENRTLTAIFPKTTGLYEGARVKVLGVSVGSVRSITVVGTSVKAVIEYDADVDLPENVQAMIVPPSIVGDRFVQLAPAYLGGTTLPDGATLGLDRTGVPVELDDTFESLDELTRALGPDGANADGALSRLVSATADNLRGNGKQLNQTIRAFSQAMGTLAAGSEDIGGTIDQLAKVSTNFAGNDAEIRRLVRALTAVSGELNASTEIEAAVKQLRTSLGLLGDFVSENRDALGTTTRKLTRVADTLADRTDSLDEVLRLAPVGLTSLLNSGEPTNFDPTDLTGSIAAGRTGSATLRGALFDELDNQLAYALGGVCASLPAGSAPRVAPLCNLLQAAGTNVGATLTEAIRALMTEGADPPVTLAELLGGTR